MKDYDKKNYLVPVMVGAPDYKYNAHIRKLVTSVQFSNSSNFGAYLAGLWEGDGHIWISTKTQKIYTSF